MKVLECEMTVHRESRGVSSRVAPPYCTLVQNDPSRPLWEKHIPAWVHTYVTLIGPVEVGIGKFLIITNIIITFFLLRFKIDTHSFHSADHYRISKTYKS